MRRYTRRARLIFWVAGAVLALIAGIGAEPLYAQGVLTARYENLALGGGRLTVTINVAVQRWDQLYIQVAPTDRATSFRVRTPGWRISGIVRDDLGRTLLLLQRDRPKMGLETLIVEGPEGRGRQGTLALARGGLRFLTVTDEPTFLPVEVPPVIGGSGAVRLRGFDANGNDRLDDPEFFAVIDAWIAGMLDDATFFLAIDLWVAQRPISSAGTGRGALRVRAGPSGVFFHVQALGPSGPGTRLTVRIYTLDGRPLFAGSTKGKTLRWNYRGRDGKAVPNGVYLYEVTVQGQDGQTLRSEIRKLLVLR